MEVDHFRADQVTYFSIISARYVFGRRPEGHCLVERYLFDGTSVPPAISTSPGPRPQGRSIPDALGQAPRPLSQASKPLSQAYKTQGQASRPPGLQPPRHSLQSLKPIYQDSRPLLNSQ